VSIEHRTQNYHCVRSLSTCLRIFPASRCVRCAQKRLTYLHRWRWEGQRRMPRRRRKPSVTLDRSDISSQAECQSDPSEPLLNHPSTLYNQSISSSGVARNVNCRGPFEGFPSFPSCFFSLLLSPFFPPFLYFFLFLSRLSFFLSFLPSPFPPLLFLLFLSFFPFRLLFLLPSLYVGYLKFSHEVWGSAVSYPCGVWNEASTEIEFGAL